MQSNNSEQPPKQVDTLFDSTLYHATSSDFDTFNLNHLGSKKGTGFPLGHLGLYFTPCPLLASIFCKNVWTSPRSKFKTGSRVIPVTITPSKIRYMSAMEWISTSSCTGSTVAIREALIAGGYDCVVVETSDFICENELYVPQIVVLNPSIISFNLLTRPERNV